MKIHFDFNPDTCLKLAKRGAILVDSSIANTYGVEIQKKLGYDLLSVPSGEIFKTRETKQMLEDELLKRKLGKDTVLIALGGGVTTDLVGFLASTYMRGVPLVLIPTTLLAMVDAAIGGKTGVNTPFGKNSIGSFYLPKAIFIDLRWMQTLPTKELKNGLAEILKYGLIADPSIWAKCSNWEKELKSLIEASIQCKLNIVQQDPEEKRGLRRILNFGHTIGHALELVSNYQIPHGEAVALGCMAESYLSAQLGYLSSKDLNSILQLYRNLGYNHKKFDPKALKEALLFDKKSKEGIPRFVLIDRIGHCLSFQEEYCTSIEKEELDNLIAWMNDDKCKN
jgi:3-dehydroquinate synthase